MGMAVNLELGDKPEPVEETSQDADEGPMFGALVVKRTLRSGQKIHHPGHVIIIGDVHAGAEVVAGGHVIVWGKLHGVVHAGASGDEDATVYALDLSPTQLRIAGRIAVSPEGKLLNAVPEMARVQGRQIEAVPWGRQ